MRLACILQFEFEINIKMDGCRSNFDRPTKEFYNTKLAMIKAKYCPLLVKLMKKRKGKEFKAIYAAINDKRLSMECLNKFEIILEQIYTRKRAVFDKAKSDQLEITETPTNKEHYEQNNNTKVKKSEEPSKRTNTIKDDNESRFVNPQKCAAESPIIYSKNNNTTKSSCAINNSHNDGAVTLPMDENCCFRNVSLDFKAELKTPLKNEQCLNISKHESINTINTTVEVAEFHGGKSNANSKIEVVASISGTNVLKESSNKHPTQYVSLKEVNSSLLYIKLRTDKMMLNSRIANMKHGTVLDLIEDRDTKQLKNSKRGFFVKKYNNQSNLTDDKTNQNMQTAQKYVGPRKNSPKVSSQSRQINGNCSSKSDYNTSQDVKFETISSDQARHIIPNSKLTGKSPCNNNLISTLRNENISVPPLHVLPSKPVAPAPPESLPLVPPTQWSVGPFLKSSSTTHLSTPNVQFSCSLTLPQPPPANMDSIYSSWLQKSYPYSNPELTCHSTAKCFPQHLTCNKSPTTFPNHVDVPNPQTQTYTIPVNCGQKIYETCNKSIGSSIAVEDKNIHSNSSGKPHLTGEPNTVEAIKCSNSQPKIPLYKDPKVYSKNRKFNTNLISKVSCYPPPHNYVITGNSSLDGFIDKNGTDKDGPNGFYDSQNPVHSNVNINKYNFVRKCTYVNNYSSSSIVGVNRPSRWDMREKIHIEPTISHNSIKNPNVIHDFSLPLYNLYKSTGFRKLDTSRGTNNKIKEVETSRDGIGNSENKTNEMVNSNTNNIKPDNGPQKQLGSARSKKHNTCNNNANCIMQCTNSSHCSNMPQNKNTTLDNSNVLQAKAKAYRDQNKTTCNVPTQAKTSTLDTCLKSKQNISTNEHIKVDGQNENGFKKKGAKITGHLGNSENKNNIMLNSNTNIIKPDNDPQKQLGPSRSKKHNTCNNNTNCIMSCNTSSQCSNKPQNKNTTSDNSNVLQAKAKAHRDINKTTCNVPAQVKTSTLDTCLKSKQNISTNEHIKVDVQNENGFKKKGAKITGHLGNSGNKNIIMLNSNTNNIKPDNYPQKQLGPSRSKKHNTCNNNANCIMSCNTSSQCSNKPQNKNTTSDNSNVLQAKAKAHRDINKTTCNVPAQAKTSTLDTCLKSKQNIPTNEHRKVHIENENCFKKNGVKITGQRGSLHTQKDNTSLIKAKDANCVFKRSVNKNDNKVHTKKYIDNCNTKFSSPQTNCSKSAEYNICKNSWSPSKRSKFVKGNVYIKNSNKAKKTKFKNFNCKSINAYTSNYQLDSNHGKANDLVQMSSKPANEGRCTKKRTRVIYSSDSDNTDSQIITPSHYPNDPDHGKANDVVDRTSKRGNKRMYTKKRTRLIYSSDSDSKDSQIVARNHDSTDNKQQIDGHITASKSVISKPGKTIKLLLKKKMINETATVQDYKGSESLGERGSASEVGDEIKNGYKKEMPILQSAISNQNNKFVRSNLIVNKNNKTYKSKNIDEQSKLDYPFSVLPHDNKLDLNLIAQMKLLFKPEAIKTICELASVFTESELKHNSPNKFDQPSSVVQNLKKIPSLDALSDKVKCGNHSCMDLSTIPKSSEVVSPPKNVEPGIKKNISQSNEDVEESCLNKSTFDSTPDMETDVPVTKSDENENISKTNSLVNHLLIHTSFSPSGDNQIVTDRNEIRDEPSMDKLSSNNIFNNIKVVNQGTINNPHNMMNDNPENEETEPNITSEQSSKNDLTKVCPSNNERIISEKITYNTQNNYVKRKYFKKRCELDKINDDLKSLPFYSDITKFNDLRTCRVTKYLEPMGNTNELTKKRKRSQINCKRKKHNKTLEDDSINSTSRTLCNRKGNSHDSIIPTNLFESHSQEIKESISTCLLQLQTQDNLPSKIYTAAKTNQKPSSVENAVTHEPNVEQCSTNQASDVEIVSVFSISEQKSTESPEDEYLKIAKDFLASFSKDLEDVPLDLTLREETNAKPVNCDNNVVRQEQGTFPSPSSFIKTELFKDENITPTIHSEITESLQLQWKSPSVLKELLTTEKLGDFYKCMDQDCTFTHYNVNEFSKHLRLHVKLDKFSKVVKNSWQLCAYCDVQHQEVSSYLAHLHSQHSNSNFQCHYCFYRFTSVDEALMHQKEKHVVEEPRVLQCLGRRMTRLLDVNLILPSKKNLI